MIAWVSPNTDEASHGNPVFINSGQSSKGQRGKLVWRVSLKICSAAFAELYGVYVLWFVYCMGMSWYVGGTRSGFTNSGWFSNDRDK